MRVAIVGSRSVPVELYADILPYVPANATEILSGGAEGADTIAEIYARKHLLPLYIFRPNYARYRRSAPLKRNQEIVRRSDYVLVLWDGHSRGSAQVIKACLQEYKPVRVLLIRDGKLISTLFDQQDGRLL